MFDLLGPIGAIQSESGTLEYGNVGLTDCVYLKLVGDDQVIPVLIYTAEELEALTSMVEDALQLSASTKPGSIVRLGALRPKPISLRLALIHPHQGTPFALLRMVQGNWSKDIQVGPSDLVRLLQMGHQEGAPTPLLGKVKLVSDGVWSVGGKEVHLLEGLSPGTGSYGEYLHPQEVVEGEELELFTFPAEGKEWVATFRASQRWNPPQTVEQPLGQEADVHLFAGQTHRCRTKLRRLSKELLQSGEVDAYWAAKIALSTLLSHLVDGDDKAAQTVWLGRAEDPLLKLGVTAIEGGQATLPDQLVYHQISAYFHSLNPDLESALGAVQQTMQQVCLNLPPGRNLKRIALNNWYLHLKEVFEGTPPPGVLQQWETLRRTHKLELAPKAICYPPPRPWNIERSDPVRQVLPSTETSSPLARQATPHAKAPVRSLVTFAALGFCLLFLLIGNWMASSDPKPLPTSTSKTSAVWIPRLSVNGCRLSYSWEQVGSARNYSLKNPKLISDGVDFWARFDLQKNLNSLTGTSLEMDGKRILGVNQMQQQVLTIFGEPQLKEPNIYHYIFDDGRKCYLHLKFGWNNQLENVQLQRAGPRWEKTEAAPLLDRLENTLH